MDFKHVLPIEVNYALKHMKDRVRPVKPDIDENALRYRRRVFFLDAPAYGNIGDQAIAYAMETFVADVLPGYKQVEVTEDQLPAAMKWLRGEIRKDDIICLTGGGNMGVMYQRYESVRRLVIRNFKDNPIVIFPQTLDYGADRYGIRELNKAAKLYGEVKKLVLCARDEESYHEMKRYFPDATVIFCPDIVLYLDYRENFAKTDEVGVCLRDDRERVLTDEQTELLLKRFPQAQQLTTMDETELPITWRNRRKVVERKLGEFGSKKLVLTDRLHGTIFSFITDTPCLAFPNSNGKVERVCRYLSENGSVRFTKSVEEALPERAGQNRTIREEFGELANVLKSIAEH